MAEQDNLPPDAGHGFHVFTSHTDDLVRARAHTAVAGAVASAYGQSQRLTLSDRQSQHSAGERMKHKVSELEGALLDAAMEKARGKEWSLAELSAGQRLADTGPWLHYGPSMSGTTLEIAAKRAFVASKFGEEIDL